ncbi:hypothetical protein [Roseovarius salinarum]|uniref:hypothetical protein n=1 Tax=Roseovarius salinarum TaxID=1981892 RepID=UPI0012FFE8F1|nr:hypothetical protein [Roseovarius salinarum]
MKSRDIHEALVYLQNQGMTNDQLNELHHKRSKESFGKALGYWSVDRNMSPKSEEYGQRLLYVMKRHQEGEQSFSRLITESWQHV